MTQHNAALVEETNAAIEQTESQAVELDKIVEVFVVDDGIKQNGTPSSAARTRSRAPAPSRAPVRAKVASAARTYLSAGSAAIKSDEWAEF
ncbi:MAG: hypothetical protein ABIQ30_06660 [Devosia sp.]